MAEGGCLRIVEGEGCFCYARAKTACCSKTDYKSHYKADVDGWGKYLELRTNNKKKVRESCERAAQHHHIVCVAAIGKVLGEGRFKLYAEQTKWCINEKPNLIGLPMWPLHMMHYCDLSRATPTIRSEAVGEHQFASVEPPPFKNLPMHDQDHDLYLKEVDDTLKEMADDLKPLEGENKCQDPKATLLEQLKNVIDKYSEQLLTNGHIGTHNSWNKGINAPESDWYVAFSMSREPRTRIHPMADGDYRNKLNNLHTAFWLEGQPLPFE